MTQDAKKDEFRKYLEKAGVLELLTKSLVSLYEEPEKPNDALSYLKNSVGGSPSDKETIAKLREENEMLKQKVKELEASQATLESRVATLSAAGTSSSNATEEKEEEKTPAALATQTSPEPAAVASTEAPSEASMPSQEPKPAEEKPAPEAPAAAEPMETEASSEPAASSAEAPKEASPVKEKEGEAEAGGEWRCGHSGHLGNFDFLYGNNIVSTQCVESRVFVLVKTNQLFLCTDFNKRKQF